MHVNSPPPATSSGQWCLKGNLFARDAVVKPKLSSKQANISDGGGTNKPSEAPASVTLTYGHSHAITSCITHAGSTE